MSGFIYVQDTGSPEPVSKTNPLPITIKGNGINPDGSLSVATRRNPYPSRVFPKIEFEPAHPVKWISADGKLWTSHQTQGLLYSDDYGASWKVQLPTATAAESVDGCALIITDNNRALWFTQTGKVIGSSIGMSSWDYTPLVLSAGYGSISYGVSKFNEMILVGAYGSQSSTATPREVYMSIDNGGNFKKLYEAPLSDEFHVHDVSYDPYSDRVWASFGDNKGRNIGYCDDYYKAFLSPAQPVTWTWLWANTDGSPIWGAGRQPTSITHTPDSIIFGSDQFPDGLDIIFRKKGNLRPVYTKDDLIQNYFRFDDDITTMRHVFHRGYSCNESGSSPLWIFVASPINSQGMTRLIATVDGVNFFEIFKHTDPNVSILYAAGFAKGDPNNYFFVQAVSYGGNRLYRFKVPTFV